MKHNASMDVVEFAYQIIDMQRTIEKQADEIERLRDYEQRYHRLLNKSISDGEVMIRQLTELVLK